MKNKTEYRSYDFEMRALNDEKHGNFIEGVPIVFNQKTDMGDYDEIIAPGALDHCNLRDVRFLVNHNFDMVPLARSRRNNDNSTMQMKIEEDGMHIRVNLDTENNSEAKNLYSAIQRGDVSGMSFCFIVNGDKWDGLEGDHPTRTITSMEQVLEVSAVTFPAYEQTEIHARSRNALEEQRAALEKARAEKLKVEQEERARAITLFELSK